MTTTTTMLDAALTYATRGWAVFPIHSMVNGRCSCGKAECRDAGKHPRILGWQRNASTDEEQIRRWWQTWPEANIGVRTGAESGIFVLDAEASALDTIEEWQQERGLFPLTPMVRTGGGGLHVYFTHPGVGRIKTAAGQLVPGIGIDTRGDGGYAVAPPSNHRSGDHYTWLDNMTVPKPAPPWLLTRVLESTAPSNGHHDDGEPIHEPGRNSALASIAGRMRRAHLEADEMISALRRINRERCQPPLGDDEVEEIARSIGRYPPAALEAPSPNGTDPGDPAPLVIRAVDVAPEEVTWIWYPRIAHGKLALLEGDPGLGKSVLTIEIAAKLSTGAPLPTGMRQDPVNTLFLSAEDGVADTIVPRLIAAGADLSRIFFMNENTPVTIPENIDRIAWAMEENACQMLIIDPLSAYLSENYSENNNQDVRRALKPLKSMLEEIGAGNITLRHWTKAVSSTAVYRGAGSIGITAAARITMMVARDPEQEDLRILASVKNNLAPEPESLAYSVVPSPENTAVPIIEWRGTSLHTAHDLQVPGEDDLSPRIGDAVDWLKQYLRGGVIVMTKQLMRDAEQAGIKERTMKRARKQLGVEAKKDSAGSWGVWLPGSEDQQRDNNAPPF